MIDFYTWRTPNGYKISICLEEMRLAYETHPINIMKDEQFADDFLKIAPNNKIPAIVDRDTGVSLFESGAILLYLAEKSGRFAASGDARWTMVQWLMWQMGGQGPMLGQAHHFLHFNPGKAPYATERFGKEAKRIYGVLDARLAEAEHVAGDLTVADFAIFPWVARHPWQQIDLNDYANVKRWYLALAAREGVQRGVKVPDPDYELPMP